MAAKKHWLSWHCRFNTQADRKAEDHKKRRKYKNIPGQLCARMCVLCLWKDRKKENERGSCGKVFLFLAFSMVNISGYFQKEKDT